MNMHRIGTYLFTVILLSLIARNAPASDFYVSTIGNDANPGTLSRPWRTIQKACSTVPAGSTVQIRAGRYNEKVQVNVSGSAAGGWIVIENYPGEHVVVDGDGLHRLENTNTSWPSDNIFLLQDVNYIQISGLEIVNNSTGGAADIAAGAEGSAIRIFGSGDHIALLRNTIHHTTGPDSMAITAYGTESARPISHLTVDDNSIYDCTPAHSETLTLDGNVENFEVAGNLIHDVNNIGIDFIGGEGKCPTHTLDAARNGVCLFNNVSYVHSAYDSAAAAIYVDGAHDIVIANNQNSFSDEGLEVGAENKGMTAFHITVRDNLIYENRDTGIIFGGYDPNKTGSVNNCAFLNNTCYHNDTLGQNNGELVIQYHASNNVIKNNLFVATGQNLFVSQDPNNVTSLDNVCDYNLYYCPGGTQNAQFMWGRVDYGTYADYVAGSHQDAHSLFANPRFVNTISNHLDLHLRTTSPAINRGEPSFQPAPGERDLFDGARLLGVRVDIGAQEVR